MKGIQLVVFVVLGAAVIVSGFPREREVESVEDDTDDVPFPAIPAVAVPAGPTFGYIPSYYNFFPDFDLVSRIKGLMTRLKTQIGDSFGGIDWSKGNTTSTTKVIDGHVVTVNETSYKDDDSDLVLHVKVIDVKPTEGAEESSEVPSSTANDSENDVAPSAISSEDTQGNEIPNKISPFMFTEAMLGTSAFTMYSKSVKHKKRGRRNRNKRKNNEEIIITEDEGCDIEEINSNCIPSTSFGRSRQEEKGRKSYDNRPMFGAKKQVGVEVIDIDENSDDAITIENESKQKKRKRSSDKYQDDDEIICEYVDRDKNGSPVGKSSKNEKKKTKYCNSSGNVLKHVDDAVVTAVSDESEDGEDEEDSNSGDSLVEGRKLFLWLISPVIPEDFFSNTWEKRPLHIKRGVKDYYTPVMSTAVIDKMLRNNNIQFTKNLDITSYTDGKRETHNPEGRALPSVVWDYYKNGCSVRLLNPQTFIPKLALLNTTLQDYFGCFVGANAYLTPPDSQGFAPHYDDIEAFILQVEGKKHWRLYAPKSESEVLPRFSSGNFSQDEIGKPIMEVTLEPGDLLYFPRGTIHQGNTVNGHHSLHITLSCYQRNTWGDLLEKVVTAALRVALEENVEFRKGLPRNYLSYMGIAHSDETSPERTAFIEKIKDLTGKLFNYAPIDAAVDQMGKQFMHDAMPPILTPEEKECSSFGDGYKMKENGELSSGGEITVDTKVKLLRSQILRLVTEEDGIRLYHCVDNSLEYHGNEPQFLEISEELAPAVEHLIRSYPEFVKVSQLPLEDNKQKITIVGDLWDRGLLLTEGPLKKAE